MTIISMFFGGVLNGLLYVAAPTMLVVYLFAKLGSMAGERRGFLFAGYAAATLACTPLIYIAGFYLWKIATAGLRYPQYGDEFLGFYLLPGSLVCAMAALGTVKLSEGVAHFFASRRQAEHHA